MSTFAETIDTLPFSPATENGRGFLPPLTRAIGHFLYLLGRLSDTPTRRPTDNQIREEIESIKIHFNEFTVPDFMSTQAQTHITNWRNAVDLLDTEILSWDMETRIANLRSFNNRTIQLMAFLDREALGLANSDAGQSL